jgi:hypothetical protein
LIGNAKLEAMLVLGSTRTLGDGVFVGIDSAAVLLASSDWNPEAVRAALSTAAETGPLGRIVFEGRGRVLAIANSAALLRSVTARIPNAPVAAAEDYSARFNPARERAGFEKMTRLIDYASGTEPRQPRFFSDNIASLGRVLSRVQSSSIVVRDTGQAVTQTVTYRLGP